MYRRNSPYVPSTITSTTLDPFAEIISLMDLLTPPASIQSELSNMPSSAASALADFGALSAYMEGLASSSWVNSIPISDYAYYSSQARVAASIIPEIVSLGNIEFTILASEAAAAQSSLAAAEASLSSKVFTTVTTAFGTETAVITEPLLVPIVTHQKGKLSPGQKIGLGIGISAFILLALGIGFIVYYVRRNRIRSQEAAFLEVQPSEKTLSHLVPRPAGSADNLRCSGTSSGNDNTAPSTFTADRPRPQSYYGVSLENSVEQRRVQSFHGIPSRRNSTGCPLDITAATYGNDPQASRALDMFCQAYGGLGPTEAEMEEHPTDNLHAMLPIAHELPATLVNTRLPSLMSQQQTQDGIPNDTENQGAEVHAGADTNSEASMDSWREAVTEPENAYDADNDEGEHSEGIGRAK
ncbi:hypothetical protein N431DRAFT_526085 [Stipitochalara longipes BDJ]|nr:hypothetical protein N431DRAFT_526085 [Stipitochalara longipes BDJ]